MRQVDKELFRASMRFRGGKQMQKEVTQRERRRDAGEVVKVSMTEAFRYSVPYIMLGTSALRHKEYS